VPLCRSLPAHSLRSVCSRGVTEAPLGGSSAKGCPKGGLKSLSHSIRPLKTGIFLSRYSSAA